MHATDAKTQKIEPDPKKIMTDENFGLSVQWPLQWGTYNVSELDRPLNIKILSVSIV